ncbi:MAG: hypothetical protein SGCHY_000025 [Lobulomycetales sp.]
MLREYAYDRLEPLPLRVSDFLPDFQRQTFSPVGSITQGTDDLAERTNTTWSEPPVFNEIDESSSSDDENLENAADITQNSSLDTVSLILSLTSSENSSVDMSLDSATVEDPSPLSAGTLANTPSFSRSESPSSEISESSSGSEASTAETGCEIKLDPETVNWLLPYVTSVKLMPLTTSTTFQDLYQEVYFGWNGQPSLMSLETLRDACLLNGNCSTQTSGQCDWRNPSLGMKARHRANRIFNGRILESMLASGMDMNSPALRYLARNTARQRPVVKAQKLWKDDASDQVSDTESDSFHAVGKESFSDSESTRESSTATAVEESSSDSESTEEDSSTVTEKKEGTTDSPIRLMPLDDSTTLEEVLREYQHGWDSQLPLTQTLTRDRQDDSLLKERIALVRLIQTCKSNGFDLDFKLTDFTG